MYLYLSSHSFSNCSSDHDASILEFASNVFLSGVLNAQLVRSRLEKNMELHFQHCADLYPFFRASLAQSERQNAKKWTGAFYLLLEDIELRHSTGLDVSRHCPHHTTIRWRNYIIVPEWLWRSWKQSCSKNICGERQSIELQRKLSWLAKRHFFHQSSDQRHHSWRVKWLVHSCIYQKVSLRNWRIKLTWGIRAHR